MRFKRWVHLVPRLIRFIREKHVPIRLVSALCLTAVLALYAEFHIDEYTVSSTYGTYPNVSARTVTYFEHVDSINKGCYLKRTARSTDSYTRERYDDIGMHILIADLALVRKALHRKPPVMTRQDVFRIQLYVTCLSAVLLWVPPIPLLISLAASVGLLLVQSQNIVEWNQYGWWAPGVCTVLALAAAAAIVVTHASFSYRRHLPVWIAVCTVTGLFGYLRKDCQLIALAPFAALFVLNGLVALSIAWADPRRKTDVRRLRGLFRAVRDAGATRARGTVPAAILMLTILIVPPMLLHANIGLFERLDNCKHQPKRAGHHTWHNIYIGIGATLSGNAPPVALRTYNHENIVWHDQCGVYAVKQQLPAVTGYPPEYDHNMRAQYMNILRRNPLDVFKPAMLRGIHYSLFRQAPVACCALVLVGLLGAALLVPAIRMLVARFLAASGAISAVCLVVPIIVSLTPDGTLSDPTGGVRFLYAIGLDTFLAVFPLVGVAVLTECIRQAQATAGASAVVAARDGTTPLLLRLAVVGLAVAWVGVRVVLYALRHEHAVIDSLGATVGKADKPFPVLFDSYPVHAVRAFNALPLEKRRAFASAAAADTALAGPCKLVRSRVPSPATIIAAMWPADCVYLLLDVKQPLVAQYLPVYLAYPGVQKPSGAPPANFMLLLPTHMDRGVWMFAFHAHPSVTSIVIGPPIPASPQAYGLLIDQVLGTLVSTRPGATAAVPADAMRVLPGVRAGLGPVVAPVGKSKTANASAPPVAPPVPSRSSTHNE